MSNKDYSRALAFDFGASSGRAIVGTLKDGKLTLDEVHRFSNDPVTLETGMYWDILRLFHEIKQGILKCVNSDFSDFDSIGIDTWGVDYALLDEKGRLLANPFHYRDMRNNRLTDEDFKGVTRDEIYKATGIQFIWFNTMFQLMADLKEDPEKLERAKTLLLIPDFFNYLLTGEKRIEYTNASTMQMFDPQKGEWAYDILKRLGIPTDILPKMIDAGEMVGKLSPSICEELGTKAVDVVAVASHDTGSAVAAVPADDMENVVYISSGTWSLMGMEMKKPCITEKTRELNFTNEGGVDRTVRFLKNIMGLWIIQETRRQWQREGDDLSFAQIEQLTREATPFKCFIDPDDESFATPGNMPKRIVEYCKKTGQPVPETKGEIARCIMESLAMKYRMTLEGIEAVTGKRINCINVIGGGVKDKLLCSLTASATGRHVTAGPVEATAIGNLVVQFMAQGKIEDIKQARKIISNSFPTDEYEPENAAAWDEQYKRFTEIIK
ncbi:MAG: rhamnulokinase [Ruminococcaceae bacterium]|nr:rhamnulokinase [Oscillospiraceae bacterium]